MIGLTKRSMTLSSTILAVGLLGFAIQWLPGRGVLIGSSPSPSPSAPAVPDRPGGGGPSRVEPTELQIRFEQAALMLHAGQYEYALIALDRVLSLSPDMPEAHVNAGFALLGLEEPQLARRSFERALELRARQVNAYYGLGLALEELGDRSSALGAMRTYVHLAAPDDPFVRKARSALWEWQAGAPSPAGEGS